MEDRAHPQATSFPVIISARLVKQGANERGRTDRNICATSAWQQRAGELHSSPSATVRQNELEKTEKTKENRAHAEKLEKSVKIECG